MNSKLLEKYENNPESLEMIIQFLRGRRNIPLPEKVKDILNRLNYAMDQLISLRDEKEVVAYLMHKYGYSKYQAENDIADSKRCHNYLDPDLKNFDYNFVKKQMWMLINKAIEKEDLKTAGTLMSKLYDDAREMRKEGDKPPIVPPVVIIIGTNPELLNKKNLPSDAEIEKEMAGWLKGKRGDSFVQDIDHEIVPNGED